MSDEVEGFWREQVATNEPELFGAEEDERLRSRVGSEGQPTPGFPLPEQTGGSVRALAPELVMP